MTILNYYKTLIFHIITIIIIIIIIFSLFLLNRSYETSDIIEVTIVEKFEDEILKKDNTIDIKYYLKVEDNNKNIIYMNCTLLRYMSVNKNEILKIQRTKIYSHNKKLDRVYYDFYEE